MDFLNFDMESQILAKLLQTEIFFNQSQMQKNFYIYPSVNIPFQPTLRLKIKGTLQV